MIITTRDELISYIESYVKQHGLTCDLNHIDVTNVTDMSGLFVESKFNGDISKWNTSNVTDMSAMFALSIFNGDISNWDTSNVKSMRYMFQNSKFNCDISKWNTSNLVNAVGMFSSCNLVVDLSQWNLNKCQYFNNMISSTTNIKLPHYAENYLQEIFPFDSHIDKYLNYHKPSFNKAIIRRILVSYYKPEFVTSKDFYFVKNQQNVCTNLGLSKDEMIDMIFQNYLENIIHLDNTDNIYE